MRSLLKPAAKIILTLIFIAFLIYLIIKNLNAIKTYPWELNLSYLVPGFLVMIFSLTFFPVVWRGILSSLGIRIPLKKSIQIYFIANVGRYIPGKIWQFVGRVYFLKKFDSIKVIWSMWIETLLAVLSAITCSFIFSFSSLNIIKHNRLYPILALFLILIFFTLNPKLIQKLLTKITKSSVDINIPFLKMVLFFFSFLFIWIGVGTGFYLGLKGVNLSISWHDITGVYSLSWALGLLSIFSPGGIGIRESIITVLLTEKTGGAGIAVVIALFTRAFITLGEIFFLLISIVLARFSIENVKA